MHSGRDWDHTLIMTLQSVRYRAERRSGWASAQCAFLMATALLFPWTVVSAETFDKRLAQPTLKQNKCLNCHSVTREKDGPSYQSVAEKYKDHPDSSQALFDHLTSSPTITVNGKEEAHVSFKTDDAQEIMNVVKWILSN